MLQYLMPDREKPSLPIRPSQENIEFALQSVLMGFWEVDIENNTVNCSREMLDLWAITPEDFTGNRTQLQAKVNEHDRILMVIEIEEAIKNDSIYDMEYRIHPVPGEIKWVKSRGRCIFQPGTNKPYKLTGIVYDITERKLRQEALDRALKSRDHFFKIASHELRTPLTCLELQLQVMEFDLKQADKKDLPEKFEIGLKKQKAHLNRITRIVDHILDESIISRGQIPLSPETFNLCEMVERIAGEFRIAAESSDVQVDLEINSEIKGTWDKFKIEQVVMNLLSNALRYGDKKPIIISIGSESNYAIIKVKDHGIGIKPEDQLRIFESFERATQDDSRGIGLGLYISKNLIEAHGGFIQVESSPGLGSTFSVHIPV